MQYNNTDDSPEPVNRPVSPSYRSFAINSASSLDGYEVDPLLNDMEYDDEGRSYAFLSLEDMLPNGVTRGTVQEAVTKRVVQEVMSEDVSQKGASDSDCKVPVIPNGEIPKFYFI
ncbi:unnamed protein product [Rhizopus stolonifer]